MKTIRTSSQRPTTKKATVGRDRSGQQERTRRSIREAALRLFSQRGVEGASIGDVAAAAGVSRGTFYNYFPTVDHVFQHLATGLVEDMNQRIDACLAPIEDRAQRLANGVRYYSARAHEDRDWARFMLRFAASSDTMRQPLQQGLMRDVLDGVQNGRMRLVPEQLPSALALIAGATLTSIALVVEGIETYQRAGQHTAELVLRALGLSDAEARRVASLPLPPLPEPAAAKRHRSQGG